MKPMTEYCSNCGALCCGKLKIEVRKGSEYKPFCSACFNYFRLMNIKEVRKILKQNKYSVTY
jgi:hypothetical protein